MKTKKKRSSLEMEYFFPPNSSTDLRTDAHQSQIIGGDADEDHTQIVGGYTVKLLGGCIPPSPSFGTPGPSKLPFSLRQLQDGGFCFLGTNRELAEK